jgi:hypothetical protein
LKKIFDPIRKKDLCVLPEEKVRQALIEKMINLGYPRGFIGVEKKISCLPHLKSEKFSNRRLDIICFAKNIHPKYLLYPLLIVECKKGALEKGAVEQVLGYNDFIKAFFVAVANEVEVKTFWYEGEEIVSVSFLPSYKQLINAVKSSR